jgi:hypothetical protein
MNKETIKKEISELENRLEQARAKLKATNYPKEVQEFVEWLAGIGITKEPEEDYYQGEFTVNNASLTVWIEHDYTIEVDGIVEPVDPAGEFHTIVFNFHSISAEESKEKINKLITPIEFKPKHIEYEFADDYYYTEFD